MRLHKIARRYIHAENLIAFGATSYEKGFGRIAKMDAIDTALSEGYTLEELLDEVAGIDAEEDAR